MLPAWPRAQRAVLVGPQLAIPAWDARLRAWVAPHTHAPVTAHIGPYQGRSCCAWPHPGAAAPAIAYYLPKNTDRAQIAQLAERHPSRACELQHVVRHSSAIAKRGVSRKPKSKALIAFFDAPPSGLAPAPGVREVTVDDPDGASSSSAKPAPLA